MKLSILVKRALVFYGYILLVWLMALAFNFKLNANSKYAYYAKTDGEFMLKFDAYLNQSLNAIANMQTWLRENNVPTPLFSKKNLDTSKNTLCVGIITRKRLGNRFYTMQTVASLLTRVKIEYQDRISMTLLNVNEDFVPHSDLVYLGNLIEIVNVSSMPFNNNKFRILKVRESLDYAAIMRYFYANRTSCKYVLLVEDDSIAAYSWYDRISETLDSLHQNGVRHTNNSLKHFVCTTS